MVFGLVASTKADTIGPTNCGSCLGSSYTLQYAATANPNVFDIFLTVNTSATTLPGDFLNAVAPKVSSSFTSVSFISGPSTFTNVVTGGLSATGCDGSGSGFFCSGSSSATGVPVGSGDIYHFEWAVTLASPGDLFTGTHQASIKALFVNSAGQQAGITSEDITLQPGGAPPPPPVPEPGSLLLVCTGLIGAAAGVRHRFAR
jgi:hypothetical protein